MYGQVLIPAKPASSAIQAARDPALVSFTRPVSRR